MVGYNKENLIDFLSVLDSYTIEDEVTRGKIRASFYKILISDINMFDTFKSEAFSCLLLMCAIDSKKRSKNKKLSYASISIDIATHELNRALYKQERLRSMLSRQAEINPLQSAAMERISESKYYEVLAMIMVYFNMDMQDLLVDITFAKRMLSKTLFMGDSFASLEEIANESNNSNS